LTKKVLSASLSAGQDVGMLLEMLALSTLCSTEDKSEGITSFFEKRKPQYLGR
jgi:enoyl-CoA hydratase